MFTKICSVIVNFLNFGLLKANFYLWGLVNLCSHFPRLLSTWVKVAIEILHEIFVIMAEFLERRSMEFYTAYRNK
jgi:hypothetical protein